MKKNEKSKYENLLLKLISKKILEDRKYSYFTNKVISVMLHPYDQWSDFWEDEESQVFGSTIRFKLTPEVIKHINKSTATIRMGANTWNWFSVSFALNGTDYRKLFNDFEGPFELEVSIIKLFRSLNINLSLSNFEVIFLE